MPLMRMYEDIKLLKNKILNTRLTGDYKEADKGYKEELLASLDREMLSLTIAMKSRVDENDPNNLFNKDYEC